MIDLLASHPAALALLIGALFVSLSGLIAYLVVCVDWFDENDFDETELQTRIDALFKEES